jgi:hypothetical protein
MFYNFLESLDTPSSETSDSLYELVNDEDRKKYICKYKGCGKFFRYKSEIMRHAATHSESRPFICHYDNCFKAFKRNDALENHIRSSHTKETPFVCPFPECQMKFTTHGSFRYHVLKHNKQVSDVQSTISTKEMPLLSPRKQIKLDFSADDFLSSEKETVKAELSSQKQGKKDIDDEFFVPPPRFAGKIQWEMVNDETEENSAPAPKNEDAPKEDYSHILEENKILKEKLVTSEKVIKGMQKQINDLLSSLFTRQSQSSTQFSNVSNGFSSLEDSQSQYLQDVYSGSKAKTEEPLLDMINYGENNNFFSLPEPLGSPDMFLSFGKNPSSFDF